MEEVIARDIIESENAKRIDALNDEYESLGRALIRRNARIDSIKAKLKSLEVAVPSWGVGTGGTRFARFPMQGEPTNILEKLEDCAVIQALGRNTPTVSPHFPWDVVSDFDELKDKANSLGLAFDAVNSNTFQDLPGQPRSYKFGSLTHTDPAVRAQAVEHNLEC